MDANVKEKILENYLRKYPDPALKVQVINKDPRTRVDLIREIIVNEIIPGIDQGVESQEDTLVRYLEMLDCAIHDADKRDAVEVLAVNSREIYVKLPTPKEGCFYKARTLLLKNVFDWWTKASLVEACAAFSFLMEAILVDVTSTGVGGIVEDFLRDNNFIQSHCPHQKLANAVCYVGELGDEGYLRNIFKALTAQWQREFPNNLKRILVAIGLKLPEGISKGEEAAIYRGADSVIEFGDIGRKLYVYLTRYFQSEEVRGEIADLDVSARSIVISLGPIHSGLATVAAVYKHSAEELRAMFEQYFDSVSVRLFNKNREVEEVCLW